ncbi:UNVERIFIED_CONTAM: class I heat shock protein 1 [Sesamum radiatum]|uniref:Class I heat shock protein 1 n=1 Tax=Sesamum radiatum TaxID=300843 RepID=A0AAW2QEZ8_SESRA
MSSLGPWHAGRRGGGGGWDAVPFFTSPYSSEASDPWDYGGAMTSWLRFGDRSEDPTALAHANVDWRETDRAHIFRVDLPGVRREDLKVQLEDDNVLQISGERMVEKEEGEGKWHRVERRRGSFLRRFRLPENASVEGIKCGLEHGVLTVEVPKKEVQEQPRNVRYIDVA